MQQAKSILNGSCFKEQRLITILKMRAGPNDRLVRTFGIDNAFTTTDGEYHRDFVNCAGDRINLSSIKWKSLARGIETLLHGNIERQRTSNGTVLLSRLVRITVLRAVLPVLFPNCDLPDLSEGEQDDIASYIADKVNSLWIESKTVRQTNPNDLQSLKEACQKLLPSIAIDSPRDNPLNLILPAFETLWRIVFRCFIEVQFRNKHDFERNLALLREYHNKPTSEMFTRTDTRDTSVSHIVNEALRLYPPTKRVYRHTHIKSETRPDLVAVDIEYIHHDPKVWGTDATEFRPSRWSKGEMNGIMLSSFCPFGMRPLVCPAKKIFGPRIIGLFVASLSLALDQLGEWEIVGEQDFLSKGLLKNSRDSYESLGLRVEGNLDG
jgi:dihydroceramidase